MPSTSWVLPLVPTLCFQGRGRWSLGNGKGLFLYTTINYHAPAKSAICNNMMELLSKGVV
jgi:hypothetical protein